MSRKMGALLVCVSAVAFGFLPFFARKGLDTGLQIPMLLFLRFSMAAVLLWLGVFVFKFPIPKGRALVALIAMGTVGYVGQSYAYFAAIARIPTGLAALLLYLYPIFVAVMAALFLHERLSKSKLLALALALLGTGLTLGKISGGNIEGVIWGVLSALFYGGYLVVGSRVMARAHPVTATAIVISCATTVYGCIALGQREQLPGNAEAYLWTALLALFCTVVAIGTLLAGLNVVGPVAASTLSTLEPAVTTVLGVLLLRESMQWIQFLGGALILASVVVISREPPLPVEIPEPH